jgi:hypothetical protein
VHISDIEAWCKINFCDTSFSGSYLLFLNDIKVTDLVIPNTITNVASSVFSGCKYITSITIPNSVTSIAANAFNNCTGLKAIYISDLSSWCKIQFESNPLLYAHHLFIDKAELTDLVIPNSENSILQNTFYGCSGLTSVTIPNSVTSIGSGAFMGCSSLSNITIPNSVKSIGDYTFQNCSGLTSVTIPNSVTSIGEYAYSGCCGLKILTMGIGITNIKSNAFEYCPELTDVYCYAINVPTTMSDAFNESYMEYATLHVPASAIERYRTTAPWSSFKSIVATDGSEPPTPEVKKCATPTIAYVNGKLKFTCETEGAEFVSEVTVADAKKYYDAEVPLLGVYHVTAYAMKTGYDNSDVATADFVIKGSTVTLVGDVNNDDKVDATDITKLIDILLKR